MPHPVKGPTSAFIGPKTLLENEKLGIHIAVISSTWAGVEDQLGEILAHMFMPKNRAAVISGFYSLGSLSAKLDFLRTVAKKQLSDGLYKELSGSLIPEIRRRSKERATVVHGMWGHSEQHPGALILYPPIWQLVSHTQEPMAYKQKDFEQITDRLWQLINKLKDFETRMSEFLKAQS